MESSDAADPHGGASADVTGDSPAQAPSITRDGENGPVDDGLDGSAVNISRPAKFQALASGALLGVLAFFGTAVAYPRQINSSTERLTTGWISVAIVLSGLLSFLLLSLYRRKLGRPLLAAGSVATAVACVVVMGRFLARTRDNLEPWVVQGAWFLRDEGVAVGLLLAALVFSATTSIALLVDGLTTGEPDVRPEGRPLVEAVVVVGVVVFGALQYAYRYGSLFFALVAVLALLAPLAGRAVSACFSDWAVARGDVLPGAGVPVDTTYNRRDRSFSAGGGGVGAFFRKFDGVNARLKSAGTEPLGFWWAVVLFGLAAAAWVYALANPSSDGRAPYTYVVVMFVLAGLVAVVGQSQRRADWHLAVDGLPHEGVFFWRVFNVLRVLGVALLAAASLYSFSYVLYVPEVMVLMGPFLLAGVAIAVLARKRPGHEAAATLVALGLLGLHLVLLFWDASRNSFNYYDGNADVFFPFQYLHHLPFYLLVGVPVGYLLAAEFYRLGFKYSEGGDANIRALFVTLGAFSLGLLLVLFGEWSTIPGGEISYNTSPAFTFDLSNEFSIYLLAFASALVVTATSVLVTGVLVPRLARRSAVKRGGSRGKWTGAPGSRGKRTGAPGSRGVNSTGTRGPRPGRASGGRSPIGGAARGRGPSRVKALAAGLIVVVAIGTAGGATVGLGVSHYRARPLVAYRPGNYVFWVQDSAERVAKQAMVALDPANVVDSLELHSARNEYVSFQVVARPLGPAINQLSTYISDFVSESDPNARILRRNHSVRVVDYVIHGAFPDVLKPFDRVTIREQANRVFWVTLRVPYDAKAGTYHGSLSFYFNGGERVTLAVDLVVWNFAVPRQRHLRTNIGGQTADAELVDTYDTHRINTYGFPISNASTLDGLSSGWPYTCHHNWTTGVWTFNWTAWDEKTNESIQRGFNAFSVNCPLGMPRKPPMDNERWVQSYRDYYGNVTAHLEANDWLPYAYIYFIDEFQMFVPDGYTRAQYFDLLESFLQTILNGTGGKLKIMTTTPPTDEIKQLRGYMDIYCPISTDRNKTEWDAMLAEGKEMWFYACVGPKAPWPNSHLYNRLFEARVLLWQAFLYNCQGFLYWSSHAFYHGSYGLGYNGWGDGWFVYPGEPGSGKWFDTPRWENYRDAQEDYEYLWLLNATLNYLRDHPGVMAPGEVDSHAASLQSIVSSVAGERSEYCDHPETLYGARDQLGSLLSNLATKVDLEAIGKAAWFPQ
ncbi:MAG: glycoside hydrolase domain-containing protein [Promethearchaeota archaeon]